MPRASVLLAVLAAACSSASPSASPPDAGDGTPPEAGAPLDAGPDTGSVDTDAGVDAAPPSGPQGTRLYPGASMVFYGVTSDDYVVFRDPHKPALVAVPVAGGQPQILASSFPSNGVVSISGKSVLAWTAAFQSIGQLTVWSATTGAKLASTASRSGIGDATLDGTSVIFSTNANGSTEDIVGASLDLSAPKTLLTGATFTSCNGLLRYLGTSQNAVVASCTGATSFDFASYAGPTFTKTELGTDLALVQYSMPTDADGTKLLVTQAATNEVDVIDLATAARTKIAMPGEPVIPIIFTPDGSRVCWLPVGAMVCAAVSPPSPVTVVRSRQGTVYSLPSPDQKWFWYAGAPTLNTAVWDGTFVGSLTSETPVALAPATTHEVQSFGDYWTLDSKYAMAMDVSKAPASGVGTLYATELAANAKPVQRADNVHEVRAAGGSRIALTYDIGGNGRATLGVVDFSKPAPPTPLVTQTDARIFATADGAHILYTYSAGGADDQGLWTIATPQ